MYMTSNVQACINQLRYFLLTLVFLNPSSVSSSPIRIATYNTNYLSACINSVRSEAFQNTLDHLEADVIAFQEVRDRKALERFLPNDKWTVIIDDDSTDDQNLAFAVRNGIEYSLLSGETKNADKSDFLFPSSSNFPDKRDVLAITVSGIYLGEERDLIVLNHHAKSRYGGRVTTSAMRVSAAEEIVEWVVSHNLDNVLLLGDFNDNPDDASLNTLESGFTNSLVIENDQGMFFINLSEQLVADDKVSYGLNSRSYNKTDKSLIDHVDIGSRQRNATEVSDDINVGKAMYDQILLSSDSIDLIHQNTAQLFEYYVAVTGNSDTRASDHIPVYVDAFVPPIQITALLPNPVGTDNDHETITLKVNEPSWTTNGLTLKDASGNTFEVVQPIGEGAVTTITPVGTAFSLNNAGDTIFLIDTEGRQIDSVSYTSSREGEL